MRTFARSKGWIALDRVRGDCGIAALSVLLAGAGHAQPALVQSAAPALSGLHEVATSRADASTVVVGSDRSLIHLVATKPEPKRRCVWVIDGRWKILRDGRSPLLLSVKITDFGPKPDEYWVKGTATDLGDGRVGKLWGNGSDKVFHFKYTWSDDQIPFTHPADSYEGAIAPDGNVRGTARIDQHRGAQWSNSRGLKMNPVALERWRREGALACKPPVSNPAAAGAIEGGGVAGAAPSPPSRSSGAAQQSRGFAR